MPAQNTKDKTQQRNTLLSGEIGDALVNAAFEPDRLLRPTVPAAACSSTGNPTQDASVK